MGGGHGRLLAVVLREDGAVGEPHHHEAAAAQVAGLGVHDREGQTGGDRRVDRVAPGGEDVQADLRRIGVRGRDHALGGRDGFGVGRERPVRREGAARLLEGAAAVAGLGGRLAAGEDEEEKREDRAAWGVGGRGGAASSAGRRCRHASVDSLVV